MINDIDYHYQTNSKIVISGVTLAGVKAIQKLSFWKSPRTSIVIDKNKGNKLKLLFLKANLRIKEYEV